MKRATRRWPLTICAAIMQIWNGMLPSTFEVFGAVPFYLIAMYLPSFVLEQCRSNWSSGLYLSDACVVANCINNADVEEARVKHLLNPNHWEPFLTSNPHCWIACVKLKNRWLHKLL